MWLCVIVTGVIIFAGWLWVVRHNIDRTNADLSTGIGSMEQMTDEMQKMFENMSAELKKNEVPIDVATPPADETEASDSVPVLQLELPPINADKK